MCSYPICKLILLGLLPGLDGALDESQEDVIAVNLSNWIEGITSDRYMGGCRDVSATDCRRTPPPSWVGGGTRPGGLSSRGLDAAGSLPSTSVSLSGDKVAV